MARIKCMNNKEKTKQNELNWYLKNQSPSLLMISALIRLCISICLSLFGSFLPPLLQIWCFPYIIEGEKSRVFISLWKTEWHPRASRLGRTAWINPWLKLSSHGIKKRKSWLASRDIASLVLRLSWLWIWLGYECLDLGSFGLLYFFSRVTPFLIS